MKWVISFIIALVLAMTCFSVGKDVALKQYEQQIQKANADLHECQNLWKLDVEFFYTTLCREVCVEEFEKWSC